MTDSAPKAKHRSSRRRFAPAALAAGVAASAVLALSMTGTLAAFTASITNSTNTTSSGTLVMQEVGPDGTTTCTSTDGATGINGNAFSCGTINKYGGSTTFVPGSVSSTTVKFTNKGTVPATSFILAPAACQQLTNTVAGNTPGSANDFCSKVSVTLTQAVGTGAATQVGTTKTLTAFGTGGNVTLANPVAPGVTVTFVFTITFDSTAGNTYQGLQASQPLTWTFTS